MEDQVRKPASLWLRLIVATAFFIGLWVAYGFVTTGGHSYFPSISLTGNRSYTLRITGANGLRFCGTISVKMADGSIASHHVDGVAPETFELLGRSISVDLKKCEEEGSLKVQIASNSRAAVQGITTGHYGSINLAVN